MVRAVACADVPKFTVIIYGTYGGGNYGTSSIRKCENYLFVSYLTLMTAYCHYII